MNEHFNSNSLKDIYMQDAPFAEWVLKNSFTQITDINVSKYRTLFEFFIMCQNRECHNCSGYIPHFTTELDICDNRMEYLACDERATINRQKRAQEFVQKTEHIPKAFRNVTFDNIPLVPSDVIAELNKYAENVHVLDKKGIYLHTHKHGVGRTTCLWLLVKELLRQGQIVEGFIFHTVPMFLDKLQVDQTVTGHPFMQKVMNSDFLILDDFGKSKHTMWASGKIEGIIEERIWNNKPIILSSTIPPENWAWESEHEKSLLSKINRACTSLEIHVEDETNLI